MMSIKLLSTENIDEGLIENERPRDPWSLLGYNLHNPLESTIHHSTERTNHNQVMDCKGRMTIQNPGGW